MVNTHTQGGWIYMKLIKSKKGIALLATLVVAVVAAVGAYAYFTTTGTGPGSAKVGSNTGLTITAGAVPTGLTPGGGAMSVPYSISNPSANGVQNLGVVSIAGITVDATHAGNGCLASWFTSSPATTAVGTIVAGGSYTSSGGTDEPTVQMNNIGSSQDACQGATLSFTLNAAQGS